MKGYKKSSVWLFLMMILVVSCKKNIFGPNSGTLEGRVTNVYNEPLKNILVTAKYTLDDSSVDEPQYRTISTVTDPTGYYKFDEIMLVDNEISTSKAGLEKEYKFISMTQDNNSAVIDFQLTGFPEVTHYVLGSDTLIQANNDTCTVNVSVLDVYNENESSGEYNASVILYQSGGVASIVTLDLQANSVSNYIFSGAIISAGLLAGEYSVKFEIQDSDGNVISVNGGSLIVI